MACASMSEANGATTTTSPLQDALLTDVNAFLPGMQWEARQNAVSENSQDNSFSMRNLLQEQPVSTVDLAAFQGWHPFPMLPMAEVAGGYNASDLDGLLDLNPASSAPVNQNNTALDFATPFTFASRNAPTTATPPPEPVGSYSSLVTPLSTGNHDFNLASARTNQVPPQNQNQTLALHDSFFHQPLRREPLSSAQINSTDEQNTRGPFATSDFSDFSWPLIPPAQPLGLDLSNFNTTNSTVTVEDDSLQTKNMPTTSSRKRTRAASYLDDASGSAASSSKRKMNTAGRPSTRAPSRVIVEDWPEIPDSDDLFGSDPFGEEQLKMYDLTKDDIQPGHLIAKEVEEAEEDDQVRLAKFECIICMDSASNLTVTHCGHMFCAQCLHQAIHTEITKKICPMCRQKLEVRPRNRAPSKTAKTFFHLELKLMPSKRQGKQRAR